VFQRFKVAARYTGGLLGPLGGRVVAPMLPQIWRFAGAALAPLAWLPLYHVAPSRAFGAAGASLLLAVPALRATGRTR
jgi:hypothetical protein